MSLWKRMESDAKQLLVILSIGAMATGVIVDRFSVVQVNAREQQKMADDMVSIHKDIEIAQRDAETTKAATAASINGIAQQVEGISQANRETAVQSSMIAKQVNRVTEQMAQLSGIDSRIAGIETRLNESAKDRANLREEIQDLTKATISLRRKVGKASP